MRWGMRLLGKQVALAAALALCLSGCAESATTPSDTARTLLETSIAREDGTSMAALVGGNSTDVVVVSHGASSRKEDFVAITEAIVAGGYRAVAYDAGPDREVDLRTVVATERAAGAKRIVLVGGSMGGGLSIGLGASTKAAAVVALSPPAGAFGALAATPGLASAGIPLLVMVAADDQPYADDAAAIGAAYGTPPVVLAGSRHSAGMFEDHPEALRTVVDFVDQALAGSQATPSG